MQSKLPLTQMERTKHSGEKEQLQMYHTPNLKDKQTLSKREQNSQKIGFKRDLESSEKQSRLTNPRSKLISKKDSDTKTQSTESYWVEKVESLIHEKA